MPYVPNVFQIAQFKGIPADAEYAVLRIYVRRTLVICQYYLRIKRRLGS